MPLTELTAQAVDQSTPPNPMPTSTLTLTDRTYTPIAFRPALERRLIGGLAALASALWLVVIPLELVLHFS